MSVTKKLTIRQGETLSRRWRCRNTSTGVVVDLDDLGITSGTLVIRDKYAAEGGVVLVSLTTANGGIEINYEADSNGVYWSGKLVMSAADTAALIPWGEAVYTFEISDGIRDKELAHGVAVLAPTAI